MVQIVKSNGVPSEYVPDMIDFRSVAILVFWSVVMVLETCPKTVA